MNVTNDRIMLEALSLDEKLATLDKRVKQVLKLRRVIAKILKGTIADFKDMDEDTIITEHIEGTPKIYEAVAPYRPSGLIRAEENESSIEGECTVYFDVKCKIRLKPGETTDCFIIVDLEGQNKFKPGYSLARRSIYYTARLISEQIPVLSEDEKGQKQYDKLSKVCSIWICFDGPKNHVNSITKISQEQTPMYGSFRFPDEEVDLQEEIFILLDAEADLDDSADSVGGGMSSEDEMLEFLNVLFNKKLSADDRLRRLEAMGYPLHEENFEKEVKEMTVAELCYYDSRYNAGRTEEREEGIRVVIQSIKKLVNNPSVAVEHLMDGYKLNQGEAQEKVALYWDA